MCFIECGTIEFEIVVFLLTACIYFYVCLMHVPIVSFVVAMTEGIIRCTASMVQVVIGALEILDDDDDDDAFCFICLLVCLLACLFACQSMYPSTFSWAGELQNLWADFDGFIPFLSCCCE